MASQDKLILVTGGNGFIGSHLSRRLLASGYRVRVADIAAHSYFDDDPGIETLVGDLRHPDFCRRALGDVETVVHLAANMGGMGTIHETNDLVIYKDNHTITMNVLLAAKVAGVKTFLHASSACVYPEFLQSSGDLDVHLREDDVWRGGPAPQGLYGLEKLNTELVLQVGALGMDVRIARFHNIYGPRGTWKGGREKVPAALLRKIIAGSRRILGEESFSVEIWGDGTQRRSFCYIDDAVEGIICLLHSSYSEPLNIGSDCSISIGELTHLAACAVDVDPVRILYDYIRDRPVGVGSRNSCNERVSKVLGWRPTVSLENGLKETGKWIRGEIDKLLAGMGEEREEVLNSLCRSNLVDLASTKSLFAILLPITSRVSTSGSQEDCLRNLRVFVESLIKTTKDDVRGNDAKFHIRIYLAIDKDDDFLLQGPNGNRAEEVLREAGFAESDVITSVCNLPTGRICSLWRHCARRAWQEGCEYFALMGDDVVLEDKNWLEEMRTAFEQFTQVEGVPFGFGCVAFTDTSFAGMPTFPILHLTHLDIFRGQVVPDVFVNQDGDPFLYQLYRRFGCSKMISSRIHNGVGGSGNARYEKEHVKNWTFGTLDEATCVVVSWLGQDRAVAIRRLTIDVIIPCYRVNLDYIHRFLALRIPPQCSMMFIIIIDDPKSPNIPALLEAYGARADVRIRVNDKNLGASASRNRGLLESSGEWVHFLDDDVVPHSDIFLELERAIRASPNAAGFVGNVQFPIADTISSTAIHLAEVTYFWDIAVKMADSGDVPWGVTANLVARRDVQDGVLYDLAFPKTGGGEDIDYCRKKRDFAISRGREGFRAAPDVITTHPYWNGGKRYYWRFYMWAKGDGALLKLYPELVYVDYAPNSAELLFVGFVMTMVSALLRLVYDHSAVPSLSLGPSMVGAALISNVLHDCYRHLWRNSDRWKTLKTTLRGFPWVLAVLESSFVRMFSEIGRLVGIVERRELGLIGHRFDWFAGVLGEGPKEEERRNNGQRFALCVLVLAVLWSPESSF